MFNPRMRRLAFALAGASVVGLVAAPAAFAAPTFASAPVIAAAHAPGAVTQVDWNPYRRHRHRWNGGGAAVAAAALGIIGIAAANAARAHDDCDYGGCYAPRTYYAPQPYYAPDAYYAPQAYAPPDEGYYPAPETVYAAPAPYYAPRYREWRHEGERHGWRGAYAHDLYQQGGDNHPGSHR